MILSVDIVNIYLLIPKYHDNYILKYIFKKYWYIYIYIGKIGYCLLIILNIMINI